MVFPVQMDYGGYDTNLYIIRQRISLVLWDWHHLALHHLCECRHDV